MSMVKTATRSVELEPIDRLEEKVKRLVGLVDRMKAEQARAAEENQRLSRELDAMRARARVERNASPPSCRRCGRARRHPDARRRHARTARSAESVSPLEDGGRVIPVEIHGQRYPIRSSLDQEYVARLAAYVDEKIRAAADSTPTGDSLRFAVLAALNIADELFRCRDATSRPRRRPGRTRRRARAAARSRPDGFLTSDDDRESQSLGACCAPCTSCTLRPCTCLPF